MKDHYQHQGAKTAVKLAVIMVCTVCAAILLCWALGWLDKDESANTQISADYTMRRKLASSIKVDDVSYVEKNGITTVLLMGVDKTLEDTLDAGYRNGGQADFLRLMVINSSDKTITGIALDRDTMTKIVTLGVLGNRNGTRTAQLALSHAFGDGKEMSCELTVEAVEKLLLGMQIDYYLAMNMDGIGVLNDLVGGVQVTLEDDFSASDPVMTAGTTLVLNSEQAEIYVRARMDVSDGTNASRMQRQQIYWEGLYQQAIACINADPNFAESMMDILSEYLVTDMPNGRMVNEASTAAGYEILESQSIAGEHKVGEDGLMQFWMDEDSIKEIILSTIFERA